MLAGLAPVGAFVTGLLAIPVAGVLTTVVFLPRAVVVGFTGVFVIVLVGVFVVPVWLVRGVVFLMSATLGSGFLTTGTFLLLIF